MVLFVKSETFIIRRNVIKPERKIQRHDLEKMIRDQARKWEGNKTVGGERSSEREGNRGPTKPGDRSFFKPVRNHVSEKVGI